MKSPEESLGIDSETYNKIVDECIYGEQKSAWSEEDEKILVEIIVDIEVLKEQERTKYGKELYQEEIDWLKSLKQRIGE